MTEEEWERTRKGVEIWKTTGPLLEQIRLEEASNDDPRDSFSHFKGFLRPALAAFPPSETSGLVEQQAWFKKLLPK